jgi:hypothetical protein
MIVLGVALSLLLPLAACGGGGFATPAPPGMYNGNGNPLQGGGG